MDSKLADDKNDVTTLDALGSHLSLVGNMDTMRIDIVVSEHGKAEKRKGKGKSRRAFIEINTGNVMCAHAHVQKHYLSKYNL